MTKGYNKSYMSQSATCLRKSISGPGATTQRSDTALIQGTAGVEEARRPRLMAASGQRDADFIYQV